MVYTLPVFNLGCDIYSMTGGTFLTKVIRIVAEPCNLAFGKRVQGTWQDGINAYLGSSSPSLLLGPVVDVRDWSGGGQADMIECPGGSGRWYQVDQVDDIGKGFDNEHRVVWMHKAFQQIEPTRFFGCQWPIPIP